MELTIDEALQRGVSAHKEGKLQDAERLYRAILQSQPTHPDANHNLGVLAVSLNRADAALPLFKTALEANPKIEQFWLSYIDALIKTEKFDGARQVLANARQAGVAAPTLHALERQLTSKLVPFFATSSNAPNDKLQVDQDELSAAIKFCESGRYKEAQEWLSMFIDSQPKHPEALCLLSQAFLLDKQEKLAARALAEAEVINPELASVYLNKAKLFLKQSKPKAALENAQFGYERASQNPESCLVLAMCLGANKRDQDALPLIEKALTLRPEYAEAFANRALIRLRASDINGAIVDAEFAIGLKPHLIQVWMLLGSLYRQTNNLAGAIEAMKQAQKIEPTSTDIAIDLAIFLMQDNKLATAISVLKKATTLAPENSSALVKLGMAFQKNKEIEKSQKIYNNSLIIQPQLLDAFNNLGTIAIMLKNWKSALRYFEKILEIEPKQSEAHNNLGIILKELNRLEEAKTIYKKAIILKPNVAESQLNLGNTLRELGRLEEAVAIYSKALVLMPTLFEAHGNLGITLQELGKFDKAVYHFDFSHSPSAVPRTLECLYFLKLF